MMINPQVNIHFFVSIQATKINLITAKTLMNAKERSKRLQRGAKAAKKTLEEELENKVKLPQIDAKQRAKRGNGKKIATSEECQDNVNITIEELVPPLVSNFLLTIITYWSVLCPEKN